MNSKGMATMTEKSTLRAWFVAVERNLSEAQWAR